MAPQSSELGCSAGDFKLSFHAGDDVNDELGDVDLEAGEDFFVPQTFPLPMLIKWNIK